MILQTKEKKMNTANKKSNYAIKIWTDSHWVNGCHYYTGTLRGAKMWAKKYARAAFQKQKYNGFGAHIRIYTEQDYNRDNFDRDYSAIFSTRL